MEPNANAVQEYMHRLIYSFDGLDVTAEIPMVSNRLFSYAADAVRMAVPVRGKLFRFFCATIQKCPPIAGHGYDVAILNFSLSQIVGSGDQARTLMRDLLEQRCIRTVAILGHAHDGGNLPTGEGVFIRLVQPARRCCTALCLCEGRTNFVAGRLQTHIVGTRMADTIQEFLFQPELFITAIQEMGNTKAHVQYPFRHLCDAHWLLRSFFGMLVHSVLTTPPPGEPKDAVYGIGHREQCPIDGWASCSGVPGL